ncbi:hypothetical protein [Ruminococcus sp. JL13D9]|uniref:hypothetical protein n=1 Tax=Ruminococcus sp. JL13D9 TaxID=3233381 RepID=UPI00389AB0DF
MKFPNAAKGISKIFTSEILALIAAIATGVASILAAVMYASAKTNSTAGAAASGIGTLVLVLGASVLLVIALILKIVGVVQTSKDEDSFKMIIYLTIFTLIVAVIAAIFSRVTFLNNIANAVSAIGSFVTTLLIILGIGNLGVQVGNDEVIDKCSSQFKLILGIGIVALLARFFCIFLPTVPAQGIVIALAVVALVLNIIQYILYLSLLSKAKKMLND